MNKRKRESVAPSEEHLRLMTERALAALAVPVFEELRACHGSSKQDAAEKLLRGWFSRLYVELWICKGCARPSEIAQNPKCLSPASPNALTFYVGADEVETHLVVPTCVEKRSPRAESLKNASPISLTELVAELAPDVEPEEFPNFPSLPPLSMRRADEKKLSTWTRFKEELLRNYPSHVREAFKRSANIDVSKRPRTPQSEEDRLLIDQIRRRAARAQLEMDRALDAMDDDDGSGLLDRTVFDEVRLACEGSRDKFDVDFYGEETVPWVAGARGLLRAWFGPDYRELWFCSNCLIQNDFLALERVHHWLRTRPFQFGVFAELEAATAHRDGSDCREICNNLVDIRSKGGKFLPIDDDRLAPNLLVPFSTVVATLAASLWEDADEDDPDRKLSPDDVDSWIHYRETILTLYPVFLTRTFAFGTCVGSTNDSH